MFTTVQAVIDKVGINVLLQFATAKFAMAGSRPTRDDVEAALLSETYSELQAQINAWYNQAQKNVNSVIAGYVARFELNQRDIDGSVLPGIANDLMHCELAPNIADEHLKNLKSSAMAMLDKVSKGVIQIKEDGPAATRTGMRTRVAGTQFNWPGY
ncbi:hypothetical protein [Pseudoalteromonas translucida]|uniref:Orphan protein n=1 Tax=Pseudoalteromonas translucida (strain TAC 125) TaxID=326442 RepID=Q3IGL7_PSET1|nr:hypothetical protein [Pseudoalteromonas translucida]CAI86616.1 putative orphan protein [Pseudoalteromonas translucida]